MENVLDLKMAGVMELGREELKEVSGGFLDSFLLFAVVTVKIEYELAKEFLAGFGEGWSKNKM